MTEDDLEAENVQLLTSQWRKLTEERADPVRVGLTMEAAQVLIKLDERQVIRAASVHVPLFDFACTAETLKEAFNYKHAANDSRNEDAQLFLSNRWRATEGAFVTVQMLYNMSRGMHAILQEATFSKIMSAANSGIQLLKLSVRPQYLFHAGNKFDLHTGHRTSLAICNADRSAY